MSNNAIEAKLDEILVRLIRLTEVIESQREE